MNFDVSRDACSGKGYPQHNTSWIKFRAAIDECSQKRGFPMVLSVESCDDPSGCGLWIGQLANLWRTCGDIQATFASVMRNVAENAQHQSSSGLSLVSKKKMPEAHKRTLLIDEKSHEITKNASL